MTIPHPGDIDPTTGRRIIAVYIAGTIGGRAAYTTELEPEPARPMEFHVHTNGRPHFHEILDRYDGRLGPARWQQ